MGIINFAVKRPVAMTIFAAVIIILGVFTFVDIPLDLYPDMKLPYAAVITTYTGAGPEEVESQVTQLIEDSVGTLAGVQRISSQSSAGQSLVLLEFDWGTDMSTATTDIREKVGMYEGYLPDGVEKPLVVKMDPTMMPVMQLTISSADDSISLAQLQSLADDIIEPRLARIPQVASVYITGGNIREVQVEVDPVKLAGYGLTLGQVNQVLAAENFNQSSGKVERGDTKYYVRTLQQFESIDDIRDVAITTSSGNTVYLYEIATVVDGYKEVTQKTRVDGHSTVSINCMKQSDANTVQTSAAIREEMAALQAELPGNLQVNYVMDQADFINKSLATTKRMIWEGALLAMLVIYIFLRNWRSTIIIVSAIPMSIIATFILMYFTSNTLNLITLGGLALGVGRMVDDSIVMFENIYRHREMGLPAINAALEGGRQVGQAVIASTMTIIAVFAPMVFTTGIAGVLFKPLAITVSFAILCSLFVALTIVPLLSSRLLSDEGMGRHNLNLGKLSSVMDKMMEFLNGLGEKYKVLLEAALRHRGRVVLIVTGLMIFTAGLCFTPLIGAEFIPKMDTGKINISVEIDKGSKLDETDVVMSEIESRLREMPEVKTIFTSVGGSGSSFLSGTEKTETGAIIVNLTDVATFFGEGRKKDADTVAEEIRTRLADIPGLKLSVTVASSSTSNMGASADVQIQIHGDDMTVLKELSDQMEDIVRQTPGTREVKASMTGGNPEYQIRIDRQRAAAVGLTPAAVAAEIRNAMDGTVATRYRVAGDEVDVRVRYQTEGGKNMEYLSNLGITTPSGARVPLSELASFQIEEGASSINRVDQTRMASVEAYLLNDNYSLSEVVAEIQKQADQLNLPAGYTITYEGEMEQMMDSFYSLLLAFLLALILVYAVMAVQYESFFNPFVIMFSVPTALIGVVLSLVLMQRNFSVPAFIGVIMLVGIAVSNAIVYVDYLNQLREGGMELHDAVLEAGRVRLRPILMTALATILAMLPMSLGIETGSQSMAPVASAVIGGLTVSTLVTLVLVPVIYTLLEDMVVYIKTHLRRRKRVEVELADVGATVMLDGGDGDGDGDGDAGTDASSPASEDDSPGRD